MEHVFGILGYCFYLVAAFGCLQMLSIVIEIALDA
jgi:hypothetical protein